MGQLDYMGLLALPWMAAETSMSRDIVCNLEAEDPLHAYSGDSGIFVAKLNSSGGKQWYTFYGSTGTDFGSGLAVDGNGNVYVTGWSGATWNGPLDKTPSMLSADTLTSLC